MRPQSLAAVILLALSTTQIAHGNIRVDFVESAPKDSFVIKNIGQCDLANLRLEIDLAKSRGQLIFDTSAAGAGVEVFQPFEVKSGKLTLDSASTVNDGDKSLKLVIEKLLPNSSVSFTIDVDDTLPKSSLGQIRVSGNEIQGAQVRVNNGDSVTLESSFDGDNATTIMMPSCE